MSVRLVTVEHIEQTPAIDITWENVVARLNTAGLQLGLMPEIITNDPTYKAIVIADAYFVRLVLSKAEARYLLLTLTDVPNKVLTDIIGTIDKN